MKPHNTTTILGIDFFKGKVEDVVQLLKSGGLLVVPAAPALITITWDQQYYQSLQDADVVIPDSGYMTMIWNLFKRDNIKRISGLEFLISFLNCYDIQKECDILIVDPRPADAALNLNYLRDHNFTVTPDASYIAPMYKKDNVIDVALLGVIEKRKPKYILVNLGGGVQEKLGAYLKANLSYSPAIICTGAAIAFLTGVQAKIPTWADKYYMGWFLRCIDKPRLYIPRYFKAFKLLVIMLRYGKNNPLKTMRPGVVLK